VSINPEIAKKMKKKKIKKNARLSVYFGHLKPKINISKFGWYKYNIHLATPPTLDVFSLYRLYYNQVKMSKAKSILIFLHSSPPTLAI